MTSPTSLPTTGDFSRSILYIPESEALSFLILSSELTSLTTQIANASEADRKSITLAKTFFTTLKELFSILVDAHRLASAYNPKEPLLEAYVQQASYAPFCRDYNAAHAVWWDMKKAKREMKSWHLVSADDALVGERVGVFEQNVNKLEREMVVKKWLESDKVEWRGWDAAVGKTREEMARREEIARQEMEEWESEEDEFEDDW